MAPDKKEKLQESDRSSLMNSFSRNRSYIMEHADEMRPSELEARLSLIETNFAKLGEMQTDAEREQIEELYCEIKAKLLECLERTGRRAEGAEVLSSTMIQRSSKLPKLQVPEFSGKITQWTSWFNTFLTVVGSDSELDDLSKFIYLKSALGPSPLATIECLELTATNYHRALGLLKDRFENKAAILQSHVTELFSLKRIKQADSAQLRTLVDNVNAQLASLKSMGKQTEILEAVISHLVRSKLDDETIEKWEDDPDSLEIPSWTTLSQFLIKRGLGLANREGRQPSIGKGNKGDSKKASLAAAVGNTSNFLCYCCSGSHLLKKCPTFLNLSPIERYQEAKKLALCLVCFSKRHTTKACNAQRCGICHKSHHELLHRIASNDSLESTTQSKQESSALHSSLLSRSSTSFLATAVVLVRSSGGGYQKCRCVLDSGSQLNFVTSRLVTALKLEMKDTCVKLSGIGNAHSQIMGEVQATFKSRVTRFAAAESFCVLPEITQYNPTNSMLGDNWRPPKGVVLADPSFNSAESIDMLLGVAMFFKLMIVGQIQLGPNWPTLQKSILGWVVVGDFTPSSSVSLLVQECNPRNDETVKLERIVQEFWKCEEIPAPVENLTEDEKRCEENFIANIKQTESGHFSVKLPFKGSGEKLGDTYTTALSRFYNLERKLNRNLTLKEQFQNFIDEYRRLGHLEEIAPEEGAKVKYFMPHHPVIRPESLTTKLRVVFDASCKSSNGVSLNDTMLVGPKLQPDLFEILTKFRFYRYALTADIAKMYRQVLIHESHRNFQCILWRNDSEEPVHILRLKTVTYGTSAAPFLAVRCLIHLADMYAVQYPIACAAIRRCFYMDDMLCGSDTVAGLVTLKQEVSELLAKGGFELHKWRSNCGEVLTDKSVSETLSLKTEDASKALGICWSSVDDEFRFSYITEVSRVITKRAVLSELAQVFDPLGFLSPVVILGKIFLQELWLLKQEWDAELPESFVTQWEKYRAELKQIDKCAIPRSVIPLNGSIDRLELVGFSDASNRAYGAAIYARVVEKSGKIVTQLVAAKSKVSPVKVISLPKLELQGALLMTKLMAKVRECVHLQVDRVAYFTDSTIVLNWLSAHASRWTTFVANRVAQIQDLTNIQDWHKVESKSNPADIVSRGLYAPDLNKSRLWWHGPEFLMSKEDQWSKFQWQCDEENVPEKRKGQFALAVGQAEPDEMFDVIGECKFVNDFLKLQRVFSYVYRWRRVAYGKKLELQGSLLAEELEGGLRYIIYNLQNLSFHKESVELRAGKIVKSVKIQCLNPFISQECGISIIRVGGRLARSDLPYETRHPILMPSNHAAIKALAIYTHRKNLHVGAQSLCAFLRQKYWVINCRKVARKTIRDCVRCFRLRPVLGEQIMGPLPASRVKGSIHPFDRAGLDFAGPIWMHFNTRGKRPVKVYLCVFVCFLTKACHLEVVSDLSANAFIAALKRFFARRGLSSELFCDNATNFVGASNQLNGLMEATNKRQIDDECSQRGVRFHFIPPRSPHFGGLWESAVKVAKQLLVKCTNSTALNYEELATAVAQVEAVMNSRPLQPLSSDPNDYEALTPGHFLVGRPINAIVEPADDDLVKLSMTNRWKRIMLVHNLFWKRWSVEYLTELQKRTKWRTAVNNLQLDTMVLISEDNTPPGQWLLGRVEELHPGKDGAVRVATVRTKTGLFKRNVHKLCPLPLDG